MFAELKQRLAPRSRVTRYLREFAAARSELPSRSRRLPNRYFIKHGYVERPQPHYDFEEECGNVWQPEVYSDAIRLVTLFGSRRIVDVGCGNGEKLAALYPRAEIIGIDYGANIEFCKRTYAFGTWLEHDLGAEGDFPLAPEHLTNAVVICADVIEHLVRPEQLLRKLRRVIDRVDAILVSTPERHLTRGLAHYGPPPNPAHVREWAIGEFVAFLTSEHFEHGTVGLTRTHAAFRSRHTILAKLFPDEHHLASATSPQEGPPLAGPPSST